MNGEILTELADARRAADDRRAARRIRRACSTRAVAGRNAQPRAFDADISSASKLWLIVADTGSNAPERVLPVLVNAELIAADGTAVPLSSLTPVDGVGPAHGRHGRADGRRAGEELVAAGVRHRRAGASRGFRGSLDVENPRARSARR